MIQLNSYGHSVMINFFESLLIALFASFTAYMVDEAFGNIVYPLVSIYLLWAMYNVWGKVIDPNKWNLNCWHNGGK